MSTDLDVVTHVKEGKEIVRQTLRRMTPTELHNGMQAFDHCPNGTALGCFVTNAGMWRSPELAVAWLSWCYEVSPTNTCNGWQTMVSRHGDLNEWLKGECLRELAERGAAPEPEVPAQEAVATC